MKPTPYGPVFVCSAADGSLRYGESAGAIDRAHPISGSPAETLLSAIGACMVLSIAIVAARDETALKPFFVEVRATKSEQPPSHFGQYQIRVSGELTTDRQVAEAIVKSAKSVCTISNSLNGEFALAVDA
jgi:uncharacterized OsmC-like protein